MKHSTAHPRHRRHIALGISACAVAWHIAWLVPVDAASLSSGGGLRILSVRPGSGPVPLETSSPPLEGPLCYVALTITDQRSEEFDTDATAHPDGVAGAPLADATTNKVVAILDSGAGTHLVADPDAVTLGLQGSFLTGNTITIGGVGGTTEASISMPVGFFAHGLQDLTADGAIQPDRMIGQGNFACAVSPDTVTNDIPSVLGAPFMAFFPISVRNSAPVRISAQGHPIYSPAITIYADPGDPAIPTLDHHIYLELRPPTQVLVQYLALLDPEPIIPSMISLSSSLFFTANKVSLTESGTSVNGQMMMDTGAQATLISEIAALELELDLLHPEFQTEVGGIGGVIVAPGFYLDRLQVPAGGGTLTWTNVPVIVLNVGSPEGGALFGIFGSNLLRDRDLVFNGAADFPYLEVSAPLIPSNLRITALRVDSSARTEIEWWNEPAPARLILQARGSLYPGSPTWDPIATAQLSTLRGTFVITNAAGCQFFRLMAP